jgi:hypothetical protein
MPQSIQRSLDASNNKPRVAFADSETCWWLARILRSEISRDVTGPPMRLCKAPFSILVVI